MKTKVLLFTFTFFSIIGLAQAPNISYTTPQVFGLGTPITPFAPTNTGGGVPATIYGQVTTIAGSGTAGSVNATGIAASFNSPADVAIDAAGNLFIADSGNNKIRKITPAGVVTTLAGSGTASLVNGTGTAASFDYPRALCADATGNVFVADHANDRIRKITAGGLVTSFASTLSRPYGIAADAAGNIYTSAMYSHVIQKISSAGIVSTFAGNGTPGSTDGTGTGANFRYPTGLALDTSNNLYVSEPSNNSIRKINPSGTVTTLPVVFYGNYGVAIDKIGNIYIGDVVFQGIIKTDTAGVLTTLAGSGTAGSADGTGVLASFNNPVGLEIDNLGFLYIADELNHKIRKISTTGYTISPDLPSGITFDSTTGIISGTATAFFPSTNFTITAYNASGSSTKIVNLTFKVAEPIAVPQTFCSGATVSNLVATGTLLQWYSPNGTVPLAANMPLTTGTYYVSQNITGFESDKVAVSVTITKALPPTGMHTQVYGGSATLGSLSAIGNNITWYDAALSGNVLPITTPLVDNTIYYASQTLVCGGESVFRLSVIAKKISEAMQTFCTNATVGNLAGTPRYGSTAQWFLTPSGGSPLATTDVLTSGTYYVQQNTNAGGGNVGAGYTTFNYPIGITVQSDGKILVTDLNNNAIKRMDSTGQNVVILGSGFSGPHAVAVQSDGKILVVDCYNHAIKRMDANGTNIVTLGTGFYYPRAIAVQPDGKILVADQSNSSIKRMDTNGNNIEMLGSGFNSPFGIAVQTDGSILVSDTYNNLVKKMNADGSEIITLGSGFSGPSGITVQVDGKILIADENNKTLKRMNPDGTAITTIFSNPYFYHKGVAVQADGAILVTYTWNNEVIRFIQANITNRVAVTVNIGATLPPIASAQTFCNSGNVSDLVATGTAIKWYSNATVGLSLVGTTALTSGTYYASQTTSCGESASRTAVVVTINTTAVPIANAQSFCVSGTVAALTATGTAIKWYTNASTGTALLTSTTLTTATYYVSQTINGCESPRSAVVVTINNTAAPIVSGLQLCVGSTVANLTASGTALKWYANTNGGVALLPTLTLTTGTYYVSQTLNNCEGLRSAVAVFIKPAPAPTASAQSLCSGATIANLVANGTTLQWYADASSGTVLSLGTALTSAIYYVSQIINGCTSPRTAVTVIINTTALPTATAQTFCNAALVSNLVASGTALKWYGNTSGGAVLTGSTSLASGTYYVSQTINSCESSRTSVLVAVNTTAAPTALPQSFCNTATVAGLTATGTLLKWYSNVSGGTVLASSTTLLSGVYYVSQTLNGCESLRIAVNVTLTAAPSIGYSTPNNYAVGTSISPLMPINTGCPILASIYNVSTLAGIFTAGSVDGANANASFNRPNGVAVDASGNIYVADNLNNKIRKISSTGIVSTLAGSGSIGSADGQGVLASFNKPCGVAVDVAGNVYVADSFNNKIRKVTPSGLVSTLAGIGTVGLANGAALTASFRVPKGVAVDAAGVVYVADESNLVIRKITTTGIVSTLAGSGVYGFADGTGSAASFRQPSGIAVDASGSNIYVADFGDHRIRKITATGVVSTFAGDGTAGSVNGLAINSSFSSPYGVAVDVLNNVYVTDNYSCNIRKISSAGIVSTMAGVDFWGNLDGAGSIAGFYNPAGIATDLSGFIYVADVLNHKIRKISATSYQISGVLPLGLTFDSSTGIISGIPTTISSATNYTITAYNNNGSSSTVVNISVGTMSSENFDLKNNVKIYPNPNNGNFFIENNDISDSIEFIKITDLQGKLIFSTKIFSTREEIKTNGLSQGVYMLSIENVSGAKSVHKLIIK